MRPELSRYIREIAARFGYRTTHTVIPTQNLDASPVEDTQLSARTIELAPPPTFEPMRLPESAKNPFNFLVVIADDRPDDRRNTQMGVETTLGSTDQNSGVITTNTAINFLNTALRGKQGGQADVVLVDDDYGYDRNRWRPEPEQIALLAQTMGTDFTKFTPERRQRRDKSFYYVLEGMDNFYYANSVNYSLILRALGFTGSIFVVSSDPPPARHFMEAADNIRKVVPTFHPGLPITGMITKGTFARMDSLVYATSATEEGQWDQKVIAGDPRINLNSLLRGKPI